MTNTELSDVNYYIYDHLGNTRVVYQVDVLCDTFGNHQEFIELQGVYDYFPYGKILRSFSAGDQDRYLSTYHERDAETGDLQGFDYRGARFYDSDIGRFLSLDPLAVNFGVMVRMTMAKCFRLV